MCLSREIGVICEVIRLLNLMLHPMLAYGAVRAVMDGAGLLVATAPPNHRASDGVPDATGLFGRVHGADRDRGHQQRRASISAPQGEQYRVDTDDHSPLGCVKQH
ncbi:MAG: hypothetical protein ACETWG_12520 [Candidatus Neomarinimicrobiota bacterium]